LSWRTVVTNIVDVPVGESVGYGRRFQATKSPARIATIAVGYADGLHRLASNRGSALVRGRRVPIAGTISMDQAALDVTSLEDVGVGDLVTLIGQDGGSRQTADDLAEATETIPYEVLCAISARVQRRYL
jgi:alanine racemase